jgi:tripartite ATP-independent transporter DctM subunit
MDLAVVGLTLLGLLILFLGSSVWVGVSLLLVGFISFTLFTGNDPLQVLANITWNETNSYTMLTLPLFIFMGEILFRSKLSDNLFKGLTPWISFLPGKLIHVNILSSTLFAAVSGSSAATTATVGKITLPELQNRGYNRALSIGTLAGAGTLGFLIPPSMMMIVYGIAANVSIGQLFIAGIIPGLLIALGLMGYTIIRSLFDREQTTDDVKYTWRDRWKALPLILPIILLILAVLGSIYLGIATPTESAAIGVVGSLILAFASKSMSLKAFWEAILGAVKTNAMIMLIVVSASYLSVVVGYLGIPGKLTSFVNDLGLSAVGLIIILTIMYIILGMVLDGFSMIVMTLPLALPLVTAVGFDPLWFGIYLIIMIEISQITPPIGFNLFVINGLIDENIFKIAIYAIPSFIIILLIAAIITIYPDIVLWLPSIMVS